MKMKKLMMSLLLLGALPLTVVAQDDDMYFVPTKENQAKEAKTYGMPSNTYYSGSSRSVDDYNRQLRSSVMPIDSAGNDIIDFSAVRGVYPDSTYKEPAEDYKYTRQMARFDGYTPSEAYWDGYRDGRWSSPWYYNSWYGWYDYDPWYWDSPWYYSSWYSPWYYGWYRPWHYGYGWRGSYWYGGGWGRHYHSTRPVHHVHRSGRSFGQPYGGHGTTVRNRSFGSSPSRGHSSSSTTRNSSFGNSSFGGSRSSGSFGGGRSGGIGSGRSASGGRSFGGRRR